VTIQYPEQVRVMSPVHRGQHMLKRDEQGRENCTACGLCALSCPAEAITMKAKNAKLTRNIYIERKYASIYEINMLRCIFVVCARRGCPRCDLFDYSVLVLVMKEKTYFWKR
jgi:NADH-quinone oxidoreductase subunit I